ncbi:response regulator [Candidatus Omnitrophota bacterium]
MKRRILIVEDNFEVRQLEKDLLERSGYEILEAKNAKDGIALAIGEKPDLILMDIRLPSKKKGIGAARILRSNEKTRDIPIVFVTGYDIGEDTNEIKNIPNCGYITKPINIHSFVEEIEQYIK